MSPLYRDVRRNAEGRLLRDQFVLAGEHDRAVSPRVGDAAHDAEVALDRGRDHPPGVARGVGVLGQDEVAHAVPGELEPQLDEEAHALERGVLVCEEAVAVDGGERVLVALCAHFERGDRHVLRGGLHLEARVARVLARADHVVHVGLRRNESPVRSRGGGALTMWKSKSQRRRKPSSGWASSCLACPAPPEEERVHGFGVIVRALWGMHRTCARAARHYKNRCARGAARPVVARKEHFETEPLIHRRFLLTEDSVVISERGPMKPSEATTHAILKCSFNC